MYAPITSLSFQHFMGLLMAEVSVASFPQPWMSHTSHLCCSRWTCDTKLALEEISTTVRGGDST